MRKYLTFITIMYTCCAAHTGLACCRINEKSKPRQRTSARPPLEARSLSRTGTFGLNESSSTRVIKANHIMIEPISLHFPLNTFILP
ncbi:hypothetical protein EYR41_008972 [Orbilia oligospora]|uniref:Secreted protein n=1 Tax=Orbilia oligospora TaxID=2813651 RepID=A0A8H2HN17_ORBOL|nr:hypothetical protein TWF132_004096 [Orbilia oligospora]TGJ64966.1 hypothetical protein EYR41_008972 [Orbilia oligospora]